MSVKLKTNIHTAIGLQIVRRVEKQLLNECIRTINNMLEMFMFKRDACFHQLKRILDQETFEECHNLIKRVIECRHVRVLGRQKSKYEALQQRKSSGHSDKEDTTSSTYIHRSNITTEVTNKWVQNLSSTPLTKEQESLLAHGPKFVIRPKQPPVGEYIVAVEQAHSKLNQGKSEELRVELKKALKKAQNTPR